MSTFSRYGLVLLLSCPLVLPGAGSTGAAENPQEVGRQLLAEHRYAEAYDQLFIAFVQQPDDADTNFLLGRAAFEKGDFESALMAFDRVLIVHPGAVRVKLELARCHIALGSYAPARQLLTEALDTEPPAVVKGNIHRLLDSMDAKDKRYSLRGSVALGFAGDDNVQATPDNRQVDVFVPPFFPPPVPVTVADKSGDLLYTTTLTADHSYRLDTPGANWKTSVVHYTGTYQTTDHLDSQYLGVSSGPAWQLTSGANFELHPLFSQMTLDSDRYLTSWGGEGRFSWPLTTDVLLQMGAKVENKTYAKDEDAGRDALTPGLTFDELFLFGQTRLTVGISGEWEDADADWLAYDRYGVGLRLDHSLPSNHLNLWAAGHLFGTLYDAIDSRFAKTRSDEIWTFAAGLRQGLWAERDRRIDLDLGYTYTNANASIDLYTYDKTVVSANVLFSF